MLAMMNKHSIESEELRQQRNRFEQLYEEHKQLLHTAKEESHSKTNHRNYITESTVSVMYI